MPLLKAVDLTEPGQKRSLDRILDELDIKQAINIQLKPEDIENGSINDLVFTYAALNHSKVKKAEAEEITDKVRKYNDELPEFLKKYGLKNSFVDTSKPFKNDAEVKEAFENSKKTAEKWLDDIAMAAAKQWYIGKDEAETKENATAAETTYAFAKDLFYEVLHQKTDLDKDQVIEMLHQFKSLGIDNPKFQEILGAIAASTTRLSMAQAALEKKLSNGDGSAMDPDLENAISPYAAQAGCSLVPGTYGRHAVLKILANIAEVMTFDLEQEFGEGLTKLDPAKSVPVGEPPKEVSVRQLAQKSVDDLIKNIKINESLDKVVNDEMIKGASKAQLVDMYAAYGHYSVNRQAMEQAKESKEGYRNIIKDYLKALNVNALYNQKDAQKLATALADKLVSEYVKQRWAAMGGADKAKDALKTLEKGSDEKEAVLNLYLHMRRQELIEELARSKELLGDEDIDKLLSKFAFASTRAYISKGKIQEYLMKNGMGRRDPKDPEVEKAAVKYANAMGYELKPNGLGIHSLLSLAEKTVRMETWDFSDRYTKLRPLRDTGIIDPKSGSNYKA